MKQSKQRSVSIKNDIVSASRSDRSVESSQCDTKCNMTGMPQICWKITSWFLHSIICCEDPPGDIFHLIWSQFTAAEAEELSEISEKHASNSAAPVRTGWKIGWMKYGSKDDSISVTYPLHLLSTLPINESALVSNSYQKAIILSYYYIWKVFSLTPTDFKSEFSQILYFVGTWS